MQQPPAIAQLEPLALAIAALETPDGILPHHSSFQAAHAALDEERDPGRRRQYLSAIERLVPRAGPGRIFVLSFLASTSQDARYLWELHQTLLQPAFTLEQRHFFYWQLLVRHSNIRECRALDPAAVYSSLLESYRRQLNVTAEWIEPHDRDAGSIVVITNQLLGLQHAPTADCLDYCHVLQTRLKKKVLLINTADMPWTLQLPYYNPIRFNYMEKYSGVGKLNFRGESIDFYQCRKPMPNLSEIRSIVKAVLARTPAFVLSLGHSNVTADLCSRFLTVATMPFGTDLPRAKSNVFILPRKRRPDDGDFMRQWQITDGQIVEAEYTFRLPERTASRTRAELGLPQDAYVIAIVGNRLDEEVTDAVAAELSELLSDVSRAFVAFVGTFPGFPRLARRHAIFATRSVFLGYHQDVLAVYECCDAYLNPPRYGGGSSAAFALAMGLPVLTRNTGDVANIAGARFVFGVFDEIKAFVARSLIDSEHRREWAEAAKARFHDISDREAMLGHIVENVTARGNVRGSGIGDRGPEIRD